MALQQLSAEGLLPIHMALLLEQAVSTIDASLGAWAVAELVWTGPESVAAQSRDTAIVVNELFAQASHSVLVSTFAIKQWHRVFGSLATRMNDVPSLHARLFLHIERKWNDTRDDSMLLHEFAHAFAAEWPGVRRPEVYYDPRGLSPDAEVRASWHAKCVVVDDEVSLVTSANFTEWAQQRNVEAGALIRSPHFARQLRAQFDALANAQQVRRLPGL
jgi:phosphatidylserine/phosphatidylglycerophosphate/cardiolipin synthase-like enzyme